MTDAKAIHSGGRLTIHGAEYFNPDDIFSCGQCFRFVRNAEGVWQGVTGGHMINVRQQGNSCEIWPVPTAELAAYLQNFFDMERGYSAIAALLTAHDPVMAEAAASHRGIRILRQEPFETLISFIISQNNNIPRISKIVGALCREYGAEIAADGRVYHAFPTAEAICAGGTEKLAAIRSGFRAKYILAAAQAVAEGKIDLEELRGVPTGELIRTLCGLYGVGEKIASCVALFGYGRFDAFPIDVWMKRVMEQYYGGTSYREVFGEYAGIAQQYLYCYIRDKGK